MCKSLAESYFRNSTKINEIQIQNQAARIVTDSRYDSSAKPVIEKLGWRTVSEIIQMETLNIGYKLINGLGQIYLTEMIQGSQIDVRENYGILESI